MALMHTAVTVRLGSPALRACLSFSMLLGPYCLVGCCPLLTLRPENFGKMSVTPRLGEGSDRSLTQKLVEVASKGHQM